MALAKTTRPILATTVRRTRLFRRLFRSARSHNTLTVDQESSSEPAGPFSWKHVAHTRPRQWISRERFDYFQGSHDALRTDCAISNTPGLTS